MLRGYTLKCFVEHVESCDTTTFAGVVRRRVAPGSIIYSDYWRAYPRIFELLSDYNLPHYSVNHSHNFVDPSTGAHTQSLQAFLSELNRNLLHKGIKHYDFAETMNYVDEIIVKRIYGDQLFVILLHTLFN